MARTRKGRCKVHCVVRLGWRFMSDNHCDRLRDVKDNVAVPASAGWPVAIFTDRAAAEARHNELEREARALLNPFRFVEPYWLHHFTSLDRDELLEALRCLAPDTAPPEPHPYDGYDWLGWWDRNVGRLSDQQREQAWQLLDKVHFYEVVETRLADG